MVSKRSIPVIDLFAGPGGLGEGFSAFDDPGYQPFKIGLSIEKDRFAHQTLRLRSFFRQFPPGQAPEEYYKVLRETGAWRDLPNHFSGNPALLNAWSQANDEAMCAELGPATHGVVRERIEQTLGPRRQRGPWVLIGGPPCQAYSLVGRSRNKGKKDYRIESDHRSKLYEEYLKIIAEHVPMIFVMENVTGMLSATVEKKRIFETILSDLRCPEGESSSLRYRIVPVVSPAEPNQYPEDDPRRFIVRCEEYGVPQQRHRVILVGIRNDLKGIEVPPLERVGAPSVQSMIGSLPRVRSGLSRCRVGDSMVKLKDSADVWQSRIRAQLEDAGNSDWLSEIDTALSDTIRATFKRIGCPQKDRGAEFLKVNQLPQVAAPLRSFLLDEQLGGVCNHSTRSHLDTDIVRYLFAASYGKQFHRSPRLHDFPDQILPEHKNAKSGHFCDRFKVQLANGPATTITSHIAKDGHYFIHYDPTQCRSLTVREAARLQTFPDNYFFCGPRTEQYTQVGNAVPPWIARQIAGSVWEAISQAGYTD